MDFAIPNVNVRNYFRYEFNQSNKSISIFFNEKIVLQYIDPQYKANKSQFISFSQFSSNVVIYQYCPNSLIAGWDVKCKMDPSADLKCPTYPYSPRNGTYFGGDFDFCDTWAFPNPGTGIVSFLATGCDIYVGLFETKVTKKFSYLVTFGGYYNSKIKLFAGDFSNEIASVDFSIPNVNDRNYFRYEFDQSKKSISVFFNKKRVLYYTDSQYKASNSKFISLSQYSNNAVIYEYCPYPYNPNNFLEGWDSTCHNVNKQPQPSAEYSECVSKVAKNGGALTLAWGLICLSIAFATAMEICTWIKAILGGSEGVAAQIIFLAGMVINGIAMIICGGIMLGYENNHMKGTPEYFNAIDVCLRVVISTLFFIVSIIGFGVAFFLLLKGDNCLLKFVASIAGGVGIGCFTAGVYAACGKLGNCAISFKN